MIKPLCCCKNVLFYYYFALHTNTFQQFYDHNCVVTAQLQYFSFLLHCRFPTWIGKKKPSNIINHKCLSCIATHTSSLSFLHIFFLLHFPHSYLWRLHFTLMLFSLYACMRLKVYFNLLHVTWQLRHKPKS